MLASTRRASATPVLVRLVLGLVLLAGTFAFALAWQRQLVDAAGPSGTTPSADASRPAASDWVRIVVGAPSGAEPIEVETPRRATPAPLARREPDAAPPSRTSTPREFELTVQQGQTLSTICKAHYGTARASVVQALARHNQMRDASALREGQHLKLPALETLLAH